MYLTRIKEVETHTSAELEQVNNFVFLEITITENPHKDGPDLRIFWA